MKGKPSTLGKDRISTRVLMPRSDYEALRRIAELERTDVSTLIRRAIARYFFAPQHSNSVKQVE
jgi:hypothetical protein